MEPRRWLCPDTSRGPQARGGHPWAHLDGRHPRGRKATGGCFLSETQGLFRIQSLRGPRRGETAKGSEHDTRSTPHQDLGRCQRGRLAPPRSPFLAWGWGRRGLREGTPYPSPARQELGLACLLHCAFLKALAVGRFGCRKKGAGPSIGVCGASSEVWAADAPADSWSTHGHVCSSETY